MNQLVSFATRINALWDLLQRETIFSDDLEPEFKPYLRAFILGETLHMKDKKIVVGKNLYRRWLYKLQTKGFDCEIDF